MLFSWTSSRGAADGVSSPYKAQSAGRKLIKVDPRNTTQSCSACGSIVKKELCERVMSALIAVSHAIETTMLPGTYSSQGWNSPLRP
ncbi:MAG TPA: zinc ribbon domain-containing protein [Methanotrichaceae archaeon]|nr:zinc ribbon domain-containing protein [Methanotrichaceae archaeon]